VVQSFRDQTLELLRHRSVGHALHLLGWDTALNLNEESKDAANIPGKAGVYSTFILLGIYALVILATSPSPVLAPTALVSAI